MSWNGYERNVLLRNEGPDASGQLRFTHVALALGAADQRDARGLAVADFDNDGDMDIVINNNPGDLPANPSHTRATLLRNDVNTRHNWLAVQVEGTQSNRDGIGTMVTIAAGDRKQLRVVGVGGGYASQHSNRLYFGLASASQADVLEVQWPSGQRERFEQIAAGQVVRLTEGQGLRVQPLAGTQAGVRFSQQTSP